MMGSFQNLRLYICPAPGKTIASHSARWGFGFHVFQSRFGRSFLAFSTTTDVMLSVACTVCIAAESAIISSSCCA